ncbi:MAG: zf-HC2 domain-containing protein [Planctomycetaceae bacterium]
MKTKHFQTELALLAGDDLSEAEATEVKRHLSVCPDCRAHLQKLQKSQEALGDFAANTATLPAIDLRSRVQKSLPTPAQIHRRHNLLHTWAPAATVIVACTLLFMVMGPDSNSTAPVDSGLTSNQITNHSGPRVIGTPVTYDPVHLDQLADPDPNQEVFMKQRSSEDSSANQIHFFEVP